MFSVCFAVRSCLSELICSLSRVRCTNQTPKIAMAMSTAPTAISRELMWNQSTKLSTLGSRAVGGWDSEIGVVIGLQVMESASS